MRLPTGSRLVLAGLLLVAGCGRGQVEDPERPEAAAVEPAGERVDSPTTSGDGDQRRAADLPPQLADPGSTPDADLFLPPLEGYETDDDAGAGELVESLAHGDVPVVEARRRLILDDEGFTSGEITVVTLEPRSDGGAAYLVHRYGDAARRPVRIGGVEMQRIETEPHDAIAWVGPGFAVTFERGQERSHGWLEDVARETVRAIVP